MKLAAIDLGSNACRLLVSDVIEGPKDTVEFSKGVLVRVPLRLGFDVFETGRISEAKKEKLVKTIQSYQLLLDVYEVQHLKACATAAMRDAENAAEVLAEIKEKTGIWSKA